MSEENKKYSIGGSALMEGIMMIGPKGVGMSLRMPDGAIETQLKKQTMLKDILELTQGLKRQDLVPDSVDYGAQNAPVVKYGNVSVIIGDTTKLTRKIERLKAIMPSLEGQSGTLHLESWTEETTNIVFDKSE